MEKVDEFCTNYGLDKYGEVPIIKTVSEKTGLKHQHIVLIVILLLVLGCLSRTGQWLVSIILTFLWPAYMSFKALESPGAQDDKKWLTYWVVFGFNHCFEGVLFKLFFFVPLLRLVRTAILVYLFLSKTNGTEWFFDAYVKHGFAFIQDKFGCAIESFENFAQLGKSKID